MVEEKKRIPCNLIVRKDIYIAFRDNCKKNNLLMNIVFEAFMREFNSGDIVLETSKNKLILTNKENINIANIEKRGTPFSRGKEEETYIFNTTVQKNLYKDFLRFCSENYKELHANIIAETFLKQFSLDEFKLQLCFA